MAGREFDERVFGPYYGTPPERRGEPESPVAPPERLTRSERMARFLARRPRRPRAGWGFTP